MQIQLLLFRFLKILIRIFGAPYNRLYRRDLWSKISTLLTWQTGQFRQVINCVLHTNLRIYHIRNIHFLYQLCLYNISFFIMSKYIRKTKQTTQIFNHSHWQFSYQLLGRRVTFLRQICAVIFFAVHSSTYLLTCICIIYIFYLVIVTYFLKKKKIYNNRSNDLNYITMSYTIPSNNMQMYILISRQGLN